MLLFDRDTDALPGFDHKAIYVATLDVRDPEVAQPSAPHKIELPFHSGAPLGNRTWRVLSPSMSFLANEGQANGKGADARWAALGSVADDTGQGSGISSSKAAKTDDDTGVHIGSSTQLFADDLIIASMTSSLTRTMHSPSMCDAGIQADQPWEQGYKVSGCAVSVLHVPNGPSGPGKLRVWYGLTTVAGAAERGVLLAYAESVDGGRSFSKPLLSQYSLGNSTANNIIMPVPTTSHCMGVFIDPNEPVGSPQRYRARMLNTGGP